MVGIMFVCMDVGVAAAYLGFAMEPYNVRVHGCRSCRWGASQYFPAGKEFYLNALNTPSMNSRPLGKVRGGASPPADAVSATKAEPSEDAIGFLYLFLSCPIP